MGPAPEEEVVGPMGIEGERQVGEEGGLLPGCQMAVVQQPPGHLAGDITWALLFHLWKAAYVDISLSSCLALLGPKEAF